MNAEDVVAAVKSSMTEKKKKRISSNGRRSVKRPEEILRDVRGLKLRQRVSLVLGDEILREELEASIQNSTVNGVSKLDTIRAYQDFLLPALQPNLVSVGKGYGGNTSTVLPINDIRGENTADFSKTERNLRCKLASIYRLVDIFGWSEAIFNHISVRVESAGDDPEFLLNPFGFLFSEVTASSLVKVDVNGNVLHGGSTDLGINKAGFILHSTIHEARPDIHCVIHVHTSDVVAVASMKCGFLRISQESLIVGGVSYHDYWGILIDEAEKEYIIQDLGLENMVMFLRNHGVVVCGKTMEDAFMLLTTVIEACESQVKALCVGLENLNIISDEAYEQVRETMRQANSVIKGEGKPRMSLAEYHFEAYMRWLDSQGYRTGYIYHMPDIFISGKPAKKQPESRVPPNVISDRDPPYQVYYNYHGPESVSPHHKPQSMGRGNTHRARMKWLNSTPVIGTHYVKEEKTVEKKAVSVEISEGNKEIPEENKVLVNGDAHIFENGLPNGDVNLDASTLLEDLNKEGILDDSGVKGVDDNSETAETVESVPATEEVKTPEPADAVPNENGEDGVNGSVALNNTQSSNEGLNITSDNETAPETPESTGDGLKPAQKVKKQKSFKKALMKKFNKKEEKKDDTK